MSTQTLYSLFHCLVNKSAEMLSEPQKGEHKVRVDIGFR